MSKLIPENSRRRFLTSLLAKAVRDPKPYLRNLKWRYIRGFFYNIRHSEISHVKALVDFRLFDVCDKVPVSVRPEIIGLEKIKIDEVQPLNFETSDSPLVSIIIPVCNHWNYTYYCLKSILENTGKTASEIIIADDCSTDETSTLLQKITGIRVISNDRTQGFLLNCNNAFRHARGKYIVFLNNDTYVLRDWLKSLISVAENDPGVGMVGSKLIDRYGRLQECGWKVGSDGWALPIGRGDNPNSFQYCGLRPVDSISGACFLIRKEAFDLAGKFDSRYIPGFFEEIDLSFAVREKGFKVLLEPKSEVIHFGSITFGDTKRQKYCSAHHGIFYNKWRCRLEAGKS